MSTGKAAETPATGPLTKAQIDAFHGDGYLVVPGFYSGAEMKRIASWVDDVGGWPETPGKHMMYFEQSRKDGSRVLNRLENFAPYHDGFERLFRADKLYDATSQLLGEKAELFKEKINFKLPGGGGFEVHQDQQAGWGAYADFFLTSMVSIDEATIENGCLEIAAGHHDRGLVHAEWEPLSDADIKGMKFVNCETKPGDAVFFDCYTPHGSRPNLSDKQRRVLYVTYNRASDGDHLQKYYADKRLSYPPDIERDPDKEYRYRV
ncbi:MAG: phytanoyl-CoA dioxygenase family protein [Alphaproteobacteria bacterium]